MTNYNELKKSGLGRGRPALSAEEKEERKHTNALRQEARRRAHIVLQHRHSDEYLELFNEELLNLVNQENK
jgi:hypothetical protein